MTDENTPKTPDTAERIAKVMARAGVASRREAERMIVEGRVTVNGQKIDSPALDVRPSDRIIVDGKRLEEPQETRLWLYYKPLGLVTTEADEKGRQTVFDALPRDMPRVMSVGRLDLNSEGLLLLTNDGELKRRLELPTTGWLRRYRVRVNGNPTDLTFASLRRGVTIDGEEFAPMEIKLDSQQGANAWLTVGIREGKNREIRRAMAHVGLQVNRLIRIGYGPFKLAGLEKNEVTEVKRRVLRDQLGGLLTGEMTEKDRPMRPRGADAPRGPREEREDRGPRRSFRTQGDRPERGEGGERPDRPRKFGAKPFGSDDRPKRFGGQSPEGQDRPRRFGGKPSDGEDRPRRFGGKPAEGGDRPRRFGGKSAEGEDRPRRFGGKPAGERRFGQSARDDSRPAKGNWGRDGGGSRRPAEAGEGGDDRKPRRFGKPGGERASFDGKRGGKPSFGGDRSERGGPGRPRAGGGFRGKPGGGKPGGGKPGGGRSGGGKPGGRPGGRPGGDKPRG
ncbi:pseudouridine synthase [Paracoccus fistulariae]|uniref:Pseudouridine synthase n=1 Tax=Paracoccus fistulariae TaxID=658446 RepID=A0ABY7SMD7_9RHOB|nr:pseudouridine synthase [Paracoccus fistulariae]MDB6180085.1 pseudouridine synthase [Paracoccus fistulariae]WCR08173.1 pseudouridine synthase [Paracoccus fistulariae]